jgi:hypothetical protein
MCLLQGRIYLRTDGTFATFSPICFFQSPRYEELFRNNFEILYCPNITLQLSADSLDVRYITGHTWL